MEHDAVGTCRHLGHLKSAAREPLVINNEPATVPEGHFDTIDAAPDEDEEMALQRVHFESATNEGDTPIVPTSKLDGLGREIDLRACGYTEHQPRRASTRAAT